MKQPLRTTASKNQMNNDLEFTYMYYSVSKNELLLPTTAVLAA
eukprot:CAMPEP_0176378064 /NCGR_PEP_ID=MMETSP0126-20121128/29346_1 /TAXON_ID=141414 ORGANISM="Strombidinopsis acuminatum, Strain SPMC142" /NCGR_SAMPLE_ID=MMETSP0126 /ASSEMBLY_ACC=CAM_ASM_000229 /LENGTH=42 /DNA_ID= /DNA_START= /DNA_END= /DNA_ORIENTATION=